MFLLPAPMTAQAIEKLNQATGVYGLALTAAQAAMLAQRESESLLRAGRMDFGGGILRELALAFAASPHVLKDTWAEMLGELIELFYAFKNETHDRLSDEELLHAMVCLFNGPAQGSLRALADCREETLLRFAAEDGFSPERDEGEEDYDDTV